MCLPKKFSCTPVAFFLFCFMILCDDIIPSLVSWQLSDVRLSCLQSSSSFHLEPSCLVSSRSRRYSSSTRNVADVVHDEEDSMEDVAGVDAGAAHRLDDVVPSQLAMVHSCFDDTLDMNSSYSDHAVVAAGNAAAEVGILQHQYCSRQAAGAGLEDCPFQMAGSRVPPPSLERLQPSS